MSYIRADLVKETTFTTGNGNITTSGATIGSRPFSDACSIGDTFPYSLRSFNLLGIPTGDFEIGIGTYIGLNTIARTTVQVSSNGNHAVVLMGPQAQIEIAFTAAEVNSLTQLASAWIASLANSTGAALIGVIKSAAGAVARTVQAKLRDRVCVFDFMTTAQIADVQANTATIDVTIPVQAALDSGYKTVYFPDGTYLVSQSIVRIRTKIEGESKRSTVIKQNGAANELIQLEQGIPNSPYVVADITEGAQVFQNICLYVTGNCGILGYNARSNTVVLNNIRVLHRDSDVSPYAPTGGTCGLRLYTASDTASFLPVIQDCEFRSFDNGVRLESVVNDFQIRGGWFLNCRNSIRLGGNSVGYINTCIETAVPGAYGVYFNGAASNNITMDTVRFEMTGSGPSALAFDASASASYGICIINPYYLISGGSRRIGSIPTSLVEILAESGVDPAINSGTNKLGLPSVLKPFTAGSGLNTNYQGFRSDGVQMFELTWTTAGNVLVIGNKNGGTVNLQINGSNAVISNLLGTTPGADNTMVLGSGALRWSTVYAGSATINTSDRDEKDFIQDVDAAALRAVRRVRFQQFKFKDAVATKGDAARWHFGVIAQEVKAAFEAEGLDAFAYGLLCYDEWDAQPEQFNDDGTLAQSAREAGNRYGVRYEELLALKLAAMEAS